MCMKREKTRFHTQDILLNVKRTAELKLDDAKEILESRDFYKYVEICGTPTTPTSYRISVDDIKEYMIVRTRED